MKPKPLRIPVFIIRNDGVTGAGRFGFLVLLLALSQPLLFLSLFFLASALFLPFTE
ncbi:MAG: hypothetical protein JO041_12715 [Acidobacteria bacterium]|nr:hypothetical protein [Acidobacteriota bacterium]